MKKATKAKKLEYYPASFTSAWLDAIRNPGREVVLNYAATEKQVEQIQRMGRNLRRTLKTFVTSELAEASKGFRVICKTGRTEWRELSRVYFVAIDERAEAAEILECLK